MYKIIYKIISGFYTAKITNYIKKGFKEKLLKIKFLIKKSVGAYVYLHQEWS